MKGEKIMLEQLKEILAKVNKNIDMDAVNESTRLIEDLDLDSLSIMLFAMEIEAAFGFRFTEPVRFVTVGEVCDYLQTRQKN
jgi:acyl carrier protein